MFVVPWGKEVCLDDWTGWWWLDPLASWFLVISYYTCYLVNILIYRANTLSYLFILDSEGENITIFHPLFYLHVVPYFYYICFVMYVIYMFYYIFMFLIIIYIPYIVHSQQYEHDCCAHSTNRNRPQLLCIF